MEISIYLLIGLFVGVVLGGITIWQINKFKKQAIHEKYKNHYISENSILSEQLRQKEQQLSEFKGQLVNITQEKEDLQSKFSSTCLETSSIKTQLAGKEEKIRELQASLQELNLEVENSREQLNLAQQKSAQAEIQLQHIVSLRTEVKEKEVQVTLERKEQTDLKEKISELRTQLEQTQEYNKHQISQLNHFLDNTNNKIYQYEQEINSAYQKCSEAEAKEKQLTDLQNSLDNKSQQLEKLYQDNTKLKEDNSRLNTELRTERQSIQEKIQLLENNQQKLTDAFTTISHEALQNNNQRFIELASRVFSNKQEAIGNLLSPLNESLEQFKQQLRKAENARLEDKRQISAQLKSLANVHSQLQCETVNLTKALGQPTVRGIWGEMQLARVLEIAGMQKPYDFIEQETTSSEERNYRPDVIINLPNHKKIIVDSKAVCSAYLEAIQVDEQSKQIEHLKRHAQHIRTHITQLGSKSYWSKFANTPEFVVMFLPREVFFSAALEQDSDLIDFGIEKKVIIATPTTLISLLKTIEYSWKQERVALNIEEIKHYLICKCEIIA